MICRKCKTANPESSVYCKNCGSPLLRKTAETKIKFSWYYLIPVGILVFIGGYFLVTSMNKSSQDLSSAAAELESPARTKVAGSGSNKNELLTGDVIIKDFYGREIVRFPAAVMRGNWVAVPIGMMIGGSSAGFQNNEGDYIPVEKVFWSENNPVILCQLEEEEVGGSMDLYPWKSSSPLEWRSLSGSASIHLEVISSRNRGLFSSFLVPPELNGPGIFLQNKRIVGWTFGEGSEVGFIWTGSTGADLLPNQDIDQFYFLVLSDSRETQMMKAIELEGADISPADKLDAYAESFRLQPKLPFEDLPPSLDLQSFLDRMHVLALELNENGAAGEVMRILDERVLMEAKDPRLIEDAVLSRLEYEDYSRTLTFLDDLKINILDNGGRTIPGLEDLACTLYKEWLRKIIDGYDFNNGLVVFEEARRLFPNDLELHLLGVEVAVKENEFILANDLLIEKRYPPQLIKQAENLHALLSQIQEEEETIVIYFNPREKQIPVDAYVNRSHKMRFFIDTGATTCSIPPSAVEMLGIEITENTPMVSVSVPGAVGLTYEVYLRSIEIEGHQIDNIRALVIEIPSHPDSGLLGLDFLNNFNMEIDNERGILKLRIR